MTLPPSTETKHESRSQKVKTNGNDCVCYKNIPRIQMCVTCSVIFVQLRNACTSNSEQIISMSATSETPGGKIYLHLSFKKRHQSVNHEPHGSVCMCVCVCVCAGTVNQPECKCVCLIPTPLIAPLYILIGDFFLSSSFSRRQTVTKAVTPHVSKLLIEDKQ